jgi:hypothetical protein
MHTTRTHTRKHTHTRKKPEKGHNNLRATLLGHNRIDENLNERHGRHSCGRSCFRSTNTFVGEEKEMRIGLAFSSLCAWAAVVQVQFSSWDGALGLWSRRIQDRDRGWDWNWIGMIWDAKPERNGTRRDAVMENGRTRQ